MSQSDALPAACAGQAALVVILEEFFFRAIFGLSRLRTLGKSLNGDLRRHSTQKETADGALESEETT